MRKFDTGATRDGEDNKLDYHGFLSPEVLKRYSEYMHKHRKQADGKLRDSDNWKKGIPQSSYMKSLIRHTMDFWREPSEDLACAIMFNVSGWLYEELKRKK